MCGFVPACMPHLFTSHDPMDCSRPGSSDRTGKNTAMGCPPPGDLLNPGFEPASLMSPALAGGFFITRATWEALTCVDMHYQLNLCFSRITIAVGTKI